MNPFALMLGLGLLAFSIFFVASPLRFKDVPWQSVRHGMKTSPVNRRQNVILALRDLDFDYQANKVTDEDYHTLRGELLTEAAQILQVQEQQKDEAIEAMIQSRRKSMPVSQELTKSRPNEPAEKLCSNCQAPLHAGAQFCSNCGRPVKEAVCPDCEQSIHPDDRFCPSCGSAVHLGQPVNQSKGV